MPTADFFWLSCIIIIRFLQLLQLNMVNADLLAKHAANYKLTKDNAAEYYKQ